MNLISKTFTDDEKRAVIIVLIEFIFTGTYYLSIDNKKIIYSVSKTFDVDIDTETIYSTKKLLNASPLKEKFLNDLVVMDDIKKKYFIHNIRRILDFTPRDDIYNEMYTDEYEQKLAKGNFYCSRLNISSNYLI